MNPNEIDWARSVGDVVATLLAAPIRAGSRLGRALLDRGNNCEIPTPCWLPKPAGTCELTIAQGGTGFLRLQITNCDWSRHTIVVTATGRLAGWLAIEPTTLNLDPQESGIVIVAVHTPGNAEPGTTLTGSIFIYGCVVHAARLAVRVARCATFADCDLPIEDCPDAIHHWYDHFYCYRSCRPAAKSASADDVLSEKDWNDG